MGSEEQRIVYPYVALSDTWARWPFFGVGISGKEVIYESSGFSVRDPNAAVGNNAFAETGIYLGIVGSILFAYVMARGVRQTGIARLGLFRTFQQTRVYRGMDCMRNMMVSAPPSRDGLRGMFGTERWLRLARGRFGSERSLRFAACRSPARRFAADSEKFAHSQANALQNCASCPSAGPLSCR